MGELVGQPLQFGCDFNRRQNQIDVIGGDRADRHVAVLGSVRRLHQRDAAFALDGFQTERTIGIGTGENDTDGEILLIGGERSEEEVDGQVVRPWRWAGRQLELPTLQGDIHARGQDVKGVRHWPLSVFNRQDGHGGGF